MIGFAKRAAVEPRLLVRFRPWPPFKENQTRSLVYLCREPRVTEKSGARVPEHSALKSVSCDIERAPDQKSGCRLARDHSLFEFNRLRRRSGARAAERSSTNCGS